MLSSGRSVHSNPPLRQKLFRFRGEFSEKSGKIHKKPGKISKSNKPYKENEYDPDQLAAEKLADLWNVTHSFYFACTGKYTWVKVQNFQNPEH